MANSNLPFLLDHLRDLRRLMFGPAPDFMSARAELDRLIDKCDAKPILPEQGMAEMFYLKKDGYYYRDGAHGYTADRYQAGLFTREYAESDVSATAGEKNPRFRVTMIPAAPGKQKETEL